MGVELFFVLVGAVAVAAVAKWRGWPAPLLVTAVALAVSLLPFVPEIEIDGHLLLNLTLPPLLYSAALDASFMSFRRAFPDIRRLGVGLVAVTAVVVGVVAWLIMPELTFAGALLLGAIVGPPDAVSAAAIGRRLGLPRRVMNVMSGESLINDATSLTLFVRVFAAIVAGATVTVWQGIWEFAVAVVVGVVVGLAAGGVLHWLRMRYPDPIVTSSVGLLMPFGAYAIAERFEGSGVLAVVAMGLYVGYQSRAHLLHDPPAGQAPVALGRLPARELRVRLHRAAAATGGRRHHRPSRRDRGLGRDRRVRRRHRDPARLRLRLLLLGTAAAEIQTAAHEADPECRSGLSRRASGRGPCSASGSVLGREREAWAGPRRP